MDKQYTVAEAAKYTGLPGNTIKTKLTRGELAYIMEMRGGKSYRVISQTALDAMIGRATQSECENLWRQYCQELLAGTIANKPCSPKHVNHLTWGWNLFWQLTEKEKRLENITGENIRLAFSKIQIDEAKKRDFHSTKMNMYKALTGFMRLLIRDGLKSIDDLETLKKNLPKARFKNIKEVPSHEEILAAIQKNRTDLNGRIQYDMVLTDVLLHLYAYGGLRRMEAANLTIHDVDLYQDAITLWGKGGKRRKIPVHPYLKNSLQFFIQTYCKDKSPDALLLTGKQGNALTETSLNTRFRRLSKKHGCNLMPHTLRHACATILALEGMPVPLIQMVLGHSDIKTTQIYLNASSRDLFAWHKAKFEAVPEQNQAQKPPENSPENQAVPQVPIFW